jgi:ribosomal-protein-alanine N-acetyltransferase
MVELVPVGHADGAALLAFELENRAFFEANINARAANFYSDAGVKSAIDGAIDDAAADRGYQFLVKSDKGDILGRINLREVERERGSAVLGYRIGAAHVRQGHASAAVRAVLEIAFGRLGLRRIVAGARTSNLGSVQVLLRSGFARLDNMADTVELNGVVHEHVYFERRVD